VHVPDLPAATMRIEPERVAELVRAFDEAAEDVRALLADVRDRGRIREPYTPDAVSTAIAEHYNAQALDGPYSALVALRNYEQQLVAARATLQRMQAGYQRSESDTAAALGRL
jgi:hypothetical protein